jgi:hypothetical protein
MIKSARIFRRYIQGDYEARQKQVEMIPPKRNHDITKSVIHAEDHMKLKGSAKSEDSLSATPPSSVNVTRKDPMKNKAKFGLLTGCLIFACAAFSMAQVNSAHNSEHGQAVHESAPSDTLVQLVRKGTSQYINVNNATAAGYGPFLGCVAGTDHGAMGIHYVNGTLLADLTLDPSQPQALIYEPDNGKLTLVGVEFILDSASWLAANGAPPVLDGQVFNFVGAPNRFNINSFFELHVWAWRDNPQGAFVDWNNDVTCTGE